MNPERSRSRLPCLLVALLAFSCQGGGRPAAPPLTTLRDLRGAIAGNPGGEREVDVRGVVTYSDVESGTLYLQDATGAAAVEVGEAGGPVMAGESVRLSGVLSAGSPRLGRPRLTVLGRSSQELMPDPRRLDVDALLSREAEAEWVEVHGVVRSVASDGPALVLDVQQGGRRFRARILNPDPARFAWLVDFRVRLRGVSTARHHARTPAQLLVPEAGHLRVEEDAPADPFAVPLAAASRLPTRPEARPDHRVRVRGTIRRTEGERDFVLAAEGGEWRVTAIDPVPLTAGDGVELVAFASAREGTLAFEQALVRSLSDPPRRGASAPSLPVLTTADQVRRLSPAEAQQGYPIRLRAVVTYNDPDMRLLFVQDATAGIYVEAWRHIHRVLPGDRVEIEGRSSPGAFAPIVDHPRVRVLGPGPLPAARRVRPERLVSGQEDSQWVEVEGVVRAVTNRGRAAVIRMAEGGVRFPVEMLSVPAPELAPLVDARVRVRAVCRSLLTLKGQLADVTLHSPGLAALRVLTPPPADAAALPLRPIHTLLQFAPGRLWDHRVRVRGVATYSQPGELYLWDGTGGLGAHRQPPSASGGSGGRSHRLRRSR